jgi:predicted 3-demethylubiquinone-9 3-methyltransferase (glyoxalase superfamily)
MQKIIPHLWFDSQAKEAAEFYASVFPHSRVTDTATLHDTPGGDAEIVAFEVMGYSFMAISAGPLFRVTPSISFMVNLDPAQNADARENIDALWEKLIAGGKALMPLGEYPFSERYGWVEDRFGVSWQLILTNPAGEPRPPIIPAMLFAGDVVGKCEEATDLYLSVFQKSRRGQIARYPADAGQHQEGSVMFTDFMLEGQWFAAMDSPPKHDFGFNEAVSLMVMCDSQAEIDQYWEKLSAVPAAEQCGWLKDKFGVSWQIVPSMMHKVLFGGDQARLDRVTQALLPMKKLDLDTLKRVSSSQ